LFYARDEIAKIERDAPNPAERPSWRRRSTGEGRRLEGKATRVAIMNFGPPSSWQGKTENTVGIEISAQAWKDAVPLLEKDGVQVVVVRINSGGGLANEVPKFHDVYEKEYKPRVPDGVLGRIGDLRRGD